MFLRIIAFLLLAVISSPAAAQLAQYGYVVGTLEPEKSFLEKLDPADMGKYLHYHIFLKTDANTEYQVVIDVNDVSPTKPLIYRIANLGTRTPAQLQQDFGSALAASNGFHLISNTQASYGPILSPTNAQRKAMGALDYIRHPGVLAAIQGMPWQSMLAQTTSDPLQWTLPLLDSLFKTPPRRRSAIRIYVFGAPFTSGGNGMHVVHQNQADMAAQFAGTNAPWQDGGIIIESRRGPPFSLVASRKLLMVKFTNQTDFSVESNDLALLTLPGHTVAPTVQTYPLPLICGDYPTFGPFSASQLEVTTTGVTAVPYGPNSAPAMKVYIKKGSFTGPSDLGDVTLTDTSTDAAASARAFGRAYSSLGIRWRHPLPRSNVRSNYYVRVQAIDPNSWCDSEITGTLRVAHY